MVWLGSARCGQGQSHASWETSAMPPHCTSKATSFPSPASAAAFCRLASPRSTASSPVRGWPGRGEGGGEERGEDGLGGRTARMSGWGVK